MESRFFLARSSTLAVLGGAGVLGPLLSVIEDVIEDSDSEDPLTDWESGSAPDSSRTDNCTWGKRKGSCSLKKINK
jgi:hypothetical protein